MELNTEAKSDCSDGAAPPSPSVFSVHKKRPFDPAPGLRPPTSTTQSANVAARRRGQPPPLLVQARLCAGAASRTGGRTVGGGYFSGSAAGVNPAGNAAGDSLTGSAAPLSRGLAAHRSQCGDFGGIIWYQCCTRHLVQTDLDLDQSVQVTARKIRLRFKRSLSGATSGDSSSLLRQ